MCRTQFFRKISDIRFITQQTDPKYPDENGCGKIPVRRQTIAEVAYEVGFSDPAYI